MSLDRSKRRALSPSKRLRPEICTPSRLLSHFELVKMAALLTERVRPMREGGRALYFDRSFGRPELNVRRAIRRPAECRVMRQAQPVGQERRRVDFLHPRFGPWDAPLVVHAHRVAEFLVGMHPVQDGFDPLS